VDRGDSTSLITACGELPGKDQFIAAVSLMDERRAIKTLLIPDGGMKV